jgi:hypothetical protein
LEDFRWRVVTISNAQVKRQDGMIFRALRKQTRYIYEVYEHDRFI